MVKEANAYNHYDRIMDHVKSSYPGATFTPEANPTIHLPYSKGGLKFSLLGYKLGDGDQGGEFPLMEAGNAQKHEFREFVSLPKGAF